MGEDSVRAATFALFTDFGADDICVGQVKAALLHGAPGSVIVDLVHRVPSFGPRAGAHLLAALQRYMPRGTVLLAVVDPGVGGPREPVAVEADGKWYVGPDNGLLSVVAARAAGTRCWRIVWRPQMLSASFEGRDVFAPMAARITGGGAADRMQPVPSLGVQLGPGDVAEGPRLDDATGVRVSCAVWRDALRAALPFRARPAIRAGHGCRHRLDDA